MKNSKYDGINLDDDFVENNAIGQITTKGGDIFIFDYEGEIIDQKITSGINLLEGHPYQIIDFDKVRVGKWLELASMNGGGGLTKPALEVKKIEWFIENLDYKNQDLIFTLLRDAYSRKSRCLSRIKKMEKLLKNAKDDYERADLRAKQLNQMYESIEKDQW